MLPTIIYTYIYTGIYIYSTLSTGTGGAYNDVWTSSNMGVSWDVSTLAAAWTVRVDMQAVKIEGTIILMGGGEYIYMYMCVCI